MRAAALVATLAVAGCAPHAAIGPTAFTTSARPQKIVDDPSLIRRYVERLPIGSALKVEETSGTTSTVILMAVDGQGMVVKPKTRIPEPARTIAFDRIVRVELAGQGHGFAKGFGIGAAVGAGSVFLWLLLLIAAGD
jgi:hypothetical protein